MVSSFNEPEEKDYREGLSKHNVQCETSLESEPVTCE